jgi:hypothetical protein
MAIQSMSTETFSRGTPFKEQRPVPYIFYFLFLKIHDDTTISFLTSHAWGVSLFSEQKERIYTSPVSV